MTMWLVQPFHVSLVILSDVFYLVVATGTTEYFSAVAYSCAGYFSELS